MTEYPNSTRYYASTDNQKKTIFTIAGLFLITVAFALLLQNNTVKWLMILISLVYPVVIIFSILEVRPKSNFLIMNEEGFILTRLGIKRKPILWSTIDSLGKIGYLHMDGVGIKYNSLKNRNSWKMEFMRRKFGYDEVILNFYSKEGKPLPDDAIIFFNSWSKSHTKKPLTQTSTVSRDDWILPL